MSRLTAIRVALLTALLVIAGPAGTARAGQAAEVRVSVEVQDAPLVDALNQLFRSTPYSFMLEPGVSGIVTLHVQDVPFEQALRAVLAQNHLTYRIENGLYAISWMAGSTGPPAAPSLGGSPGKQRMLYVNRHGSQDQLCVRIFPYPGYERVLWDGSDLAKDPFLARDRRLAERLKDLAISYYLPSPAFDRVLIVSSLVPVVLNLRNSQQRVIAAEQVAAGRHVLYALWSGNQRIRLLLAGDKSGRSEWEYDADTGTLREVGSVDNARDFLEPPFAAQVQLLADLIARGKRDPEWLLPLPLRPADAFPAIIRGAGIGYDTPRWLNLPAPVAAMSRDGRYLALTTGNGAVLLIATGGQGPQVERVIPATTLVTREWVRLTDLRWAPDSGSVTFTEVHVYAAARYSPDMPLEYPVPDTRTWLVRRYSLSTGEAETLVLGRDAFLAPASAGKWWFEH